MGKIAYIDEKRMHKETRKMLNSIIPVVEDYKEQGYRMTLRQLYYQLVAKLIIKNRQPMYKKLGRILTDARLTGMVDWDFIEDRGRVPLFPNQFDGIQDAKRVLVSAYRLNRWEDQEFYLEVAVEKEALVGVLAEPVTDEYHVHLVANKGYNSTTEMHNMALRFKDHVNQKCILLYFGDHDPSGEDMVRDIGKRMETFGVDFEIIKIALTMKQIEQYKLPPNPTKMSDPRAYTYTAKHGNYSYELDALPPDVLVKMVQKEIEKRLDRKLMEEVIEQEEKDKEEMVRRLGDED